MGEREPQELVAQHVVPVGVLGGEAGPAQRDRCEVDGWLQAVDRAGEVIQSDPVRVDRQLREDRQHAVGAHQSRTRVFPFGHGGRVVPLHIPKDRTAFRQMEAIRVSELQACREGAVAGSPPSMRSRSARSSRSLGRTRAAPYRGRSRCGALSSAGGGRTAVAAGGERPERAGRPNGTGPGCRCRPLTAERGGRAGDSSRT